MFNRMLSTYGFEDLTRFFESMVPTQKYNLMQVSVGTSLGLGSISHFLGLTPLLVITMAIAIFAEMITGIRASSTAGKPFESFRFSRGILKICVWCVIFFIFNSFSNEMSHFNGWPYLIAAIMFQVLHASAMVWFVIENGTSILENQAVIDGKQKTEYIEAVKSIWNTFINALKGRLK